MRPRLVALGCIVGMFASCSMPEPALLPELPEDHLDAGVGDIDSGGANDAGVEEGGRIDAAACTDPCDCDGDGVKAKACGGPDCDDLDKRAKPGADFSDVPPEPPLNGNWNCDTQVDKKFDAGLNCANALFKGSCAREGFTGDPACGQEADFVTCKDAVPGVNCQNNGAAVKKKQACR